jgi:seryl-tRNA synthetase
MLTLAIIRQHPELVKERLAIKKFRHTELVDSLIDLDDRRKKLQTESEIIQSRINAASKEIGQLMAGGNKEKAEAKKTEVTQLKASLQPLSEQLNGVEHQLNEVLVTLPNLPSALVPKGDSPANNITVRESGQKPNLPADALPHWELAKKYNLIDFELGNKITGSGFPLFVDQGAKLQRAMIQYFLDFNCRAGYTEYQPPLMVNEAFAFGTG